MAGNYGIARRYAALSRSSLGKKSGNEAEKGSSNGVELKRLDIRSIVDPLRELAATGVFRSRARRFVF
jgi:hypothetical protein